MYRLEGEVAYQSGVGGIEAFVAAVVDALAFQCCVPDAHIVDTTGEALTHIEVCACQCRNARFGERLHGEAVDVGDGRRAAAHIECQVVPVVVNQFLVGQQFIVQLHIKRLNTSLVDVALAALDDQLAILEANAQIVRQLNERCIGIALLPVGTEPQLQGVVVGRLRRKGRDVDVQHLVGSQLGGTVVVVDIPTLVTHHQVA